MARVFTITEGLENMGALKTGGQGSVYKGRRTGEIITAVKILPTPIHSESADDKNFKDFQNEVEKLKKVNEKPNPNVVKIFSSGLTESGSFPFIEMEFIEGPDLEELLKPPHDPLFTIKEATKVAEQLAHALSHCHSLNVKHGDIKSNNVKFNIHTGNYVLLDFGPAIMSDEQRRTSLRHAGAIEFMAPEQHEGQMLFQTDVYSFGIVLFELLAGTVPFPLKEKGEMARNTVMVAHMETPPGDIVALRQQAIPATWSAEKSEHEMHVPAWLLSLIYKCLQKDPQQRFANGVDLYDYIIFNSTLNLKKGEDSSQSLAALQAENAKLLQEKETLQSSLLHYRSLSEKMEGTVKTLRTEMAQHREELAAANERAAAAQKARPVRRGVSRISFYALLLLTAVLAVLAAYSFLKNEILSAQIDRAERKSTATNPYNRPTPERTTSNSNNLPTAENRNAEPETKRPAQMEPIDPQANENRDTNTAESIAQNYPRPEEDTPGTGNVIAQYRVAAERAYFHNAPDESTRRGAYMIPSPDAIINVLKEESGFVYTEFTNNRGQTSKGWLRKRDLEPVEEE